MATLLDRADDAYYSGRLPLMTDAEYDRRAAATGHQPFVTAELPSLNNARRPEDFTDWLRSIPHPSPLLHVELKIDGCSVLVEFRDGWPVRARTRKLDIPTDCLDLHARMDGFTGAARGEAWHPRGRGYAAGRLRARDTSVALQWTAFAGNRAETRPWYWSHQNPIYAETPDAAAILEYWRAWSDGEYNHHSMPPSDGLVVTVADPQLRRCMGMGKRAPNYAIALK